jgi:CHAT domain-containing protein/tetratricopeptide (TPR) repeat protein
MCDARAMLLRILCYWALSLCAFIAPALAQREEHRDNHSALSVSDEVLARDMMENQGLLAHLFVGPTADIEYLNFWAPAISDTDSLLAERLEVLALRLCKRDFPDNIALQEKLTLNLGAYLAVVAEPRDDEGRLQESIRLLRNLRASQLKRGEDAPPLARTLSDALLRAGRANEALEVLDSILDNSADTAKFETLNTLGRARLDAAEIPDARQAFEDELAFDPKKPLGGFFHYSTELGIGDVDSAAGRYAEASNHYQAAFSEVDVVQRDTQLDVLPLESLSLNAFKSGDLKTAREYLDHAIAIMNVEEDKATEDSVIAFGVPDTTLRLMDQISRAASLTLGPHGGEAGGNEALWALVLRRHGKQLADNARSLAELRERLDGEDRAIFERWLSIVSRLGVLMSQNAENDGSVDLQNLFTLQMAELNLQSRVQTLLYRLGRRPPRHVWTIEEISSRLDAHSALLKFLRYKSYQHVRYGGDHSHEWRYAVGVITRNGASPWIDLGAAANIDAAISAVVDRLQPGYSPAVADPEQLDINGLISQTLRNQLFQSRDEIRKIWVWPDGAFSYFPFAAISDPSGSPWVQTRTLVLISEPAQIAEASGATSDAVIFADPNFYPKAKSATRADSKSPPKPHKHRGFGLADVYWPALPGARAEAKAIHAVLPQSLLYLGDDATPSALRNIRAPRIVHLATHGYSLPPAKVTSANLLAAAFDDSLLRSGIVLAPLRGKEKAVGLVPAIDFLTINLQGTALVVLSACDTALGDSVPGEGVMGMPRALFSAGVQSVVASLWEVDDEATRLLMTEFYQNIQSGQARSEALASAQRVLMVNPRFSNPQYWAAFELVGADGPVTRH